MKSFFFRLAVLAIIGLVVFYFVARNKNTTLGINTIQLSVSCSDFKRMLFLSKVNVHVRNDDSRPHNNIQVEISYYGKNNNAVGSKVVTFQSVEPNSEESKTITLKAKAYSCDCKIINSH